MTFNVAPSTALLSEAEDNSSTVNATDVTSQEEDTKTVLTDHEPSVMSVSSSTASHTRSYITLKPTEQVIVLSYYALGCVLLGLFRNRNSWNDQDNPSFSGLS